MNEADRYIRFDWAIKHMLRDKANFSVLEGLLTVLIGEKITIEEILESESNQNRGDDKFNRVDLKAKNSHGHIIIVEVQLTRQLYYLQRILYGTAKAVTEHISLGEDYDHIKKVYSISILYCTLGQGDDYVYHGKTVFKGLHTGTDLRMDIRTRDAIIPSLPEDVFPEYYIVRVNEFDKNPTSHLDEWMQYLKTGRIREETDAPGLQDARRKLEVMKMSEKERAAYMEHIDDIRFQNDVMQTAYYDGHADGMEKGRTEGRAEGIEIGISQEKQTIAKKLLDMGISPEVISQTTGLSLEEIAILS